MPRIVMVTGCIRSGTTAVGANMALAPGARYLYEPFNYNAGMTVISRFFEVPGTDGFPMSRFDACVDDIRGLRLTLKPGLFKRDRGLRRLVKTVIGGRNRLTYLACRLDWRLRTLIWKDPIAVFAARAVAERHGIPVLATTRTPMAVAASVKRMGWAYPLEDLDRRLASLGVAADPMVARYRDRLDRPAINGALLWRLVYTHLVSWSRSSPLIRLVDVQDIIDRPLDTYRGLYRLYGLEWTAAVEGRLARRYGRRSDGDGAAALPQRAHVSKRDLSKINVYGRELLTDEEIAAIDDIAEDLWPAVKAACLTRQDLDRGTTGTPLAAA
ncbi:MAG: hypothetical protein ACFCUO_03740 [Rhodospirillales bacterium]